MNLAPFLILALGGFFCLLVYTSRENAVVRKPSPLRRLSVTLSANAAAFTAAMSRAGVAAAAFQQRLLELQAALGVSAQDADERLRAAMRHLPRDVLIDPEAPGRSGLEQD